MVSVEAVVDPLEVGEGPHWDAQTQALYFVDLSRGSIHRYHPASGQYTSTEYPDGTPCFIVPVEGQPDHFVVGVGLSILVIRWDGKDGSPPTVVKKVGEVQSDVPTITLNDGKADPRGRLYTGTWPRSNLSKKDDYDKTGSVYCVDGGTIKHLDDGVSLANGLAWDVEQKAFYYIDSFENKIRRYDYDVETGKISNLRYIFDLKENGIEGMLDGQTIDTDGNLWVPLFGASCVLQVDPRTGKLLRKVSLPTAQVTSATFGGPNLDVLYVTTANFKPFGEQEHPAGCTFAVTGLGVKGHPNRNYKL